MPIYEYECSQCHQVFEIFHKIDEECKVACPKCLGPTKKLISATNFILKGSGFYVNDYPSKARREGSKAEKEPTESKGSPDKSSPEKTSPEKTSNEKTSNEKSEEKRKEKKAD
jgi:putative FmdB family regulatory protein